MAASLASVPLLQKKTRSAKEVSTSALASDAPGSVRYRLLTWHRRAACSASATCQALSLWPSTFTAMPAVKSRYCLSARGRTRRAKLPSARGEVWDRGADAQPAARHRCHTARSRRRA
jgi:hypothetical protein